MNNDTPKARHERLVVALNSAGRGPYKVKKNQMFSHEFEKLDTNDINAGVGLFVDFNFLSGGSVVDFDLYRLLQEYFHDKDKRDRINKIVRE